LSSIPCEKRVKEPDPLNVGERKKMEQE